jgi:hypothetical protein
MIPKVIRRASFGHDGTSFPVVASVRAIVSLSFTGENVTRLAHFKWCAGYARERSAVRHPVAGRKAPASYAPAGAV